MDEPHELMGVQLKTKYWLIIGAIAIVSFLFVLDTFKGHLAQSGASNIADNNLKACNAQTSIPSSTENNKSSLLVKPIRASNSNTTLLRLYGYISVSDGIDDPHPIYIPINLTTFDQFKIFTDETWLTVITARFTCVDLHLMINHDIATREWIVFSYRLKFHISSRHYDCHNPDMPVTGWIKDTNRMTCSSSANRYECSNEHINDKIDIIRIVLSQFELELNRAKNNTSDQFEKPAQACIIQWSNIWKDS